MHDIWMKPFWIAFFVSAALAWPTLLALRALKVGSVISRYAPEAHQQKVGTPTMGGLFVVLAVIFALIATTGVSGESLAGLIYISGFAAIGLLDDLIIPRWTGKRGLGWIPKLVLQVIVVAVPALMHGVDAMSLAGAFWILCCVNAVNFADGLDGLAGSLLLIALVPFVVHFSSNSQPALVAVGAAVAGGVIPFLVINAPPAKLFMGDLGALALGGAYGFLFASSPWDSQPWPWLVSLIFVLELVLVPLQILAVKTIRRRIFPATPIHHAFEVRGWPESKVTWCFILAQAVLAAGGLTLRSTWQ